MPIDATLNGALGILALLYGAGDIQKTLDFSCAFGMDADNQAATMVGLVAITTGLEGIPKKLLYPLEDADWELPFNDSYKMITREVLTDAGLTEMAERMAAQGEKILLSKGGSIVDIDGEAHYKIPVDAEFVPPFEFNIRETLHVEASIPFEYPLYVGGPESSALSITQSDTNRIKIEDGMLKADFDSAGTYSLTITARIEDNELSRNLNFIVHSKNLAPEASRKPDPLLADGDIYETLSMGTSLRSNERMNLGFAFDEAVQVSVLSVNTGLIPEFTGWFTSLEILYKDESGCRLPQKLDQLKVE